MKLKEQTKSRVIVFSSILLISFGIFNLSTNIYGQETVEDLEPKDNWRFIQDLSEIAISTAVPILGGTISIVLQYGRTKGLQISKEAEAYIISSAQSIVATQGRLLFDKVYQNSDLLLAWGAGDLYEKGNEELKIKLKIELKKYGEEAKKQALSDLDAEIRSSKFKQTARALVGDNLGALIESVYTKNETDKAERAKNLLLELSSLAVDSALLYYDKKKLTDQDKKDIVVKGIDIVAKNFDFEFIILNVPNAKMHLEAALAKKIDS